MNLKWSVLWKNMIKIMKISLQVRLIICLIFFFSFNISSCFRSDNSTSETVTNSDVRCEFAKTNSSQNAVESDNQSQKAFRLLLQATFGPQKKDLDRVIEIGETLVSDQIVLLLKQLATIPMEGVNLLKRIHRRMR